MNTKDDPLNSADDTALLRHFGLQASTDNHQTSHFISVDTSKLYGAGLAEGFSNSDKRIQAGFRGALELLGVPLPDYAQRKAPGPKTNLLREIAVINGEQHRPDQS